MTLRHRLLTATAIAGSFIMICAALNPTGLSAQAQTTTQDQKSPDDQLRLRVRMGQHVGFGRVVLGHNNERLDAEITRPSPTTIEIKLPLDAEIDLGMAGKISEISSVQSRTTDKHTVLSLNLSGESDIQPGQFKGFYYIDIRPKTASRTSDPVPQRETAAARDAAAKLRTLEQAVKVGLINEEQAKTMRAQVERERIEKEALARSTNQGRGPNARSDDADLQRLKEDVEKKLALLNNTAAPRGTEQGKPGSRPASPSPTATARNATNPAPATNAAAEAPPAPPKPNCAVSFNLSDWRGTRTFDEELVARRQKAAKGTEGVPEMASLAELFVAYGLAPEALAVTKSHRAEDPVPQDAERLNRVRDIALLLRRQPIEATSSLLAEPDDCDRVDGPLWRALAASANGDSQTVIKNAARARALLREVPEAIRLRLALNIADGAGEDLETLKTMAAAIRGMDMRTPEDRASLYLLQARIAKVENNLADEILFLERAAREDRTSPGLVAKARLAAIEARRQGPHGDRAENVLRDLARTYRYDALGEEAGILLAERKLDVGQFGEALDLADESTRSSGRQGAESRGAVLAARILRTLFVDAPRADLPDALSRIALWWRFEGYATPGPRGDDIRMGAAQTLLNESLPEAARDVTRQIGAELGDTPKGLALRAKAEAQSARGDAQQALALLANAGDSDEIRRARAIVLAKLDRHLEAAEQLQNLAAPDDRWNHAASLYAAKEWTKAATAYANLIRDTETNAERRKEASQRYAQATLMAGKLPNDPAPMTLLAKEAKASSMLSVIEIPIYQPSPKTNGSTNEPPSMASVKDALERAKRIEKLLEQ